MGTSVSGTPGSGTTAPPPASVSATLLASVSNGIARPLFFDGQVMTAADLTLAQTAAEDELWRMRRLLHGWGIVAGLIVTGAQDRIVISSGYGVTPSGAEVYLPTTAVIDNLSQHLQLLRGPETEGCMLDAADGIGIRPGAVSAGPAAGLKHVRVIDSPMARSQNTIRTAGLRTATTGSDSLKTGPQNTPTRGTSEPTLAAAASFSASPLDTIKVGSLSPVLVPGGSTINPLDTLTGADPAHVLVPGDSLKASPLGTIGVGGLDPVLVPSDSIKVSPQDTIRAGGLGPVVIGDTPRDTLRGGGIGPVVVIGDTPKDTLHGGADTPSGGEPPIPLPPPAPTLQGWLLARPSATLAGPRSALTNTCAHPGNLTFPTRQCGAVDLILCCEPPPQHLPDKLDCETIRQHVCDGAPLLMPEPHPAPDVLILARLLLLDGVVQIDMDVRRNLFPMSLLQDYLAACLCRLATTPEPAPTGPVVTGPIHTGPIDTGPIITGPINHGPIITGPIVTGPALPGPIVTGPIVTGPIITGPVIPDPILTGPHGPIDPGPIITGPINPGPIIEGPIGAGPILTGPINSGPVIEGPIGAGPILTGPISHGPILTGPILTGPARLDAPVLINPLKDTRPAWNTVRNVAEAHRIAGAPPPLDPTHVAMLTEAGLGPDDVLRMSTADLAKLTGPALSPPQIEATKLALTPLTALIKSARF